MANASIPQDAAALPSPAWPVALLDWLRRHDRTVLLAGVGLQLVVLTAMIVMHLTTVVTGDKILLRVVPVDPRDLFRGDYVILSYDFSRIPDGAIPGHSHDDLRGQSIYVTLVPEADGQHWRMGEYSLEKPSSGKFLRGTIKVWNMHWRRADFGIESFFVQEGTGGKYEQAARSDKLSAEVVVDSSGRAVLRRLVIH